MEHQEENEAIVEPDEDGGWVDTHHNVDPSGNQVASGTQESFAEMTLDSDKVVVLLWLLSSNSLNDQKLNTLCGVPNVNITATCSIDHMKDSFLCCMSTVGVVSWQKKIIIRS